MTTLYLGRRDAEGRGIVLVHAPGQSPRLVRPLLIDSLDALAWGDHGAGARNLALALLADHLGEAQAIPPHDRFDPGIGWLIGETGAWLLHEESWREVIPPLPKERGFALDVIDEGPGGLLYAVGHSVLQRVVARAAVTILPLTAAAEDAQDGEGVEGAA